MQEAISKYTALEVLHVVGPRGKKEARRSNHRRMLGQDIGGFALPWQLVRAAGSKLLGPWSCLLITVGGKRCTGWAMNGFWLGGDCA